jgi:hypothetical protein
MKLLDLVGVDLVDLGALIWGDLKENIFLSLAISQILNLAKIGFIDGMGSITPMIFFSLSKSKICPILQKPRSRENYFLIWN